MWPCTVRPARTLPDRDTCVSASTDCTLDREGKLRLVLPVDSESWLTLVVSSRNNPLDIPQPPHCAVKNCCLHTSEVYVYKYQGC